MSDALQQVVVTADVKAGLIERATSLLSEHVMAITGLTLVGMAVGMATVGVVRMFLSDVDDQGPPEWKARKNLLKRLGAASSGLWTIMVQVTYLQAIETAWLGTLTVALGAGLLAAACNRPAFKPVKAVWSWALAKLRKKIESDGHEAGDLDDTSFPRK